MKKLFTFILLGIFILSFAAALELKPIEKIGYDWDNVEQFKKDITTSKYGKYEIRNAVLGLSWFQYGKVADIELKNNSDVCGQNCFAEKEITLYEDGILIDEVTFETEQEDGSWIYQPIRDYHFSYQGEIQDYKTVCTDTDETHNNTNITIQECRAVEDGTHIGKINYREGDIVKAGTYLLRLDGVKKPSRTVDWKIKTNGIWTDNWAVWSGTPATYTHGEVVSTFSTGVSSRWEGIVFNVSEDFILTSFTVGTSCDGVSARLTLQDGTPVETANLINDVATLDNPTSLTAGVNYWVAITSGSSWDNCKKISISYPIIDDIVTFIESKTTVATYTTEIRSVETLTGYQASVTLNSPADDSVSLTQQITFNATAEITGGATLVNMSLFTNESGDWEIRNTTGLEVDLEHAVFYYTLDDKLSTTKIIDIKGVNNGTLTGGDNTVDLSELGKINLSLKLDGVSDYIDSNQNINVDGKSFTFSAWVNLDDFGSDAAVFSTDVDNVGDRGFQLQILTDGSVGIFDGNSVFTSASGLFATGSFIFIVFIVDESNSKIYLDGVSVLNATANFNNVNKALTIGIRSASSPANFLDGNIDEVAVFNKTLSTLEILSLYNSGNGNRPNIFIPTRTFIRTITATTLWNFQACDSDGDCSFAVSNFTVSLDTTNPEIIIESPTGTLDYNFIGATETLNATFTDLGLEACWYNYNGTNVTIEGCQSGVKNSTQFILESNNTNMTLYANDSIGNINSTFINWSYTYLENNRTHNNISYETESESFNINIEGAISVVLLYNGTSYTTTKSGNNFERTLQIPVGQIGNNSIHWRFDDTQDSFTSYQNISETVFTLCNSSYSTLFLNISFKDEADSSVLNASIPTSTFIYYLGDGTVTKTYNFINTSNNYNYEFCATPNKTLNVDSFFQYKQGSQYPQRIADPAAIEYTNTTTNTTLFLLGVDEGIFATFQTINSAQQIISGVLMTAIRSIAGQDETVGVGTTGDSGSVTLWLNPDFVHDFLFVKSGFIDQSLSFAPTQPSYTITMGGGEQTINSTIKGIDYSVTPTNGFLENDTTYSFGFILTSSFWDVSEYGFDLRLANGTIITGDTSTTSGTQLSTSYDVNNQTLIHLDAFWLINGEYTNITRTWSIQNTEYTGWSIKTFFTDLTLYLDSGLFGLDDFGRQLIAFIIIFISVGIMGQKFGITSSLGITSLLFGVVLFFDVVTGILPDIRGVANLPTFIVGLILAMSILNEVQSR